MDGMIAFRIGEIPVYTFGLIVALGTLLFSGAFALEMKKRKMLCGFPLCACCAVLCGFVLGRLFFCLLDQSFLADRPFSDLLHPDYGGFSMMGALFGASLGVFIGCFLQKLTFNAVLDAAAPGMLLFVFVSRFAEWGSEELGLSRPMRTGFLMGTFLDSEGYMKVYLLEMMAALILILITLCVLNKKYTNGGVMLGTMMLFGAAQVILESLKHDGHMSFGFVGIQHVMSYLILVLGLIFLAVPEWNGDRKKRARLTVLLVVPFAAACVLIEFLLDRTPVSRWLLYAAYILLMMILCAMGFSLLQKRERKNQRTIDNSEKKA